jgi:hypothetical protein
MDYQEIDSGGTERAEAIAVMVEGRGVCRSFSRRLIEPLDILILAANCSWVSPAIRRQYRRFLISLFAIFI